MGVAAKKIDNLLVNVWGEDDDQAETPEEIRAAIWKQEHNMPKYSRDCCSFSLPPDEPGLEEPRHLLSYPEKAKTVEVPMYLATPQIQPTFVWQQPVAQPVAQPFVQPVVAPLMAPVPLGQSYVGQPPSGQY